MKAKRKLTQREWEQEFYQNCMMIDDVLDDRWFVQLVKNAARDYDIPLTHRKVRKIRDVLKIKLPDAVHNALANTRVFHPAKRRRMR